MLESCPKTTGPFVECCSDQWVFDCSPNKLLIKYGTHLFCPSEIGPEKRQLPQILQYYSQTIMICRKDYLYCQQALVWGCLYCISVPVKHRLKHKLICFIHFLEMGLLIVVGCCPNCILQYWTLYILSAFTWISSLQEQILYHGRTWSWTGSVN